MTETMNRRTTTILGAGAVLDFDFNGLLKPTTENITKAVTEEKIQGYDEIESDLIKIVYNKIVDAATSEYNYLHPAVKNYDPHITFEDLFEVIETLYSYNSTWKHEHYPFSFISVLVKSDLNYQSVDYHRSMIAIIRRIMEIVDAYDERFRVDGNEQWYKDFWKRFEGGIDVFNLNYDTTIENSLDKYTDGFVNQYPGYQRFEPEEIWNAEADVATVNHLHGCILYSDPNPEPLQYYYSHHDLYKFYSTKDVMDIMGRLFFLPRNQVGDSIFYTPIITGLKKTDKICYMPHSFYHANFAKRILENPSLLICGYSFGDLYVNQLLLRHKLVHGRNERIVIVDKWNDRVNDDPVALYRYFWDNTSGGFKEFVGRLIECVNPTVETFIQFEQIVEGCWQTPNGVLRLYTKGLKNAVDNDKKGILEFLRNNQMRDD